MHLCRVKWKLAPRHAIDILQSDYFTFTVVRHPFDRILSAYRDRILRWYLKSILPQTKKLEVVWRMVQKQKFNQSRHFLNKIISWNNFEYYPLQLLHSDSFKCVILNLFSYYIQSFHIPSLGKIWLLISPMIIWIDGFCLRQAWREGGDKGRARGRCLRKKALSYAMIFMSRLNIGHIIQRTTRVHNAHPVSGLWEIVTQLKFKGYLSRAHNKVWSDTEGTFPSC